MRLRSELSVKVAAALVLNACTTHGVTTVEQTDELRQAQRSGKQRPQLVMLPSANSEN